MFEPEKKQNKTKPLYTHTHTHLFNTHMVNPNGSKEENEISKRIEYYEDKHLTMVENFFFILFCCWFLFCLFGFIFFYVFVHWICKRKNWRSMYLWRGKKQKKRCFWCFLQQQQQQTSFISIYIFQYNIYVRSRNKQKKNLISSFLLNIPYLFTIIILFNNNNNNKFI